MTKENRNNGLDDLQAELAFQGDTLRTLDEALGRQQADILSLKEQVSLLGEELKRLKDDAVPPTTPGDEPPPHY
ncbi:MAG: SlyX family protein [Pseudomonadota bacterium]